MKDFTNRELNKNLQKEIGDAVTAVLARHGIRLTKNNMSSLPLSSKITIEMNLAHTVSIPASIKGITQRDVMSGYVSAGTILFCKGREVRILSKTRQKYVFEYTDDTTKRYKINFGGLSLVGGA
jgi:hypothetical protein